MSATITAPEMVCATFMPGGKVVYVNKKLPLKVRIEEVKGWSSLDEEVAWIREGRWDLELDETVREKLEGFIS